MRKAINLQLKIGETEISEIRSDIRSRDEIPKLLTGLQYIYCNAGIREKIFEILREIIPEETDPDNPLRNCGRYRYREHYGLTAIGITTE